MRSDRTRWHPLISTLAVALLALTAGVFPFGPAQACGPWFPNTMLSGGDETLLAAPLSDFRVELKRIHFPMPAFQAVVATNGHARETFETDVAELREALARQGLSSTDLEQRLSDYQSARRRILEIAEAYERWQQAQLFRGEDDPPHAFTYGAERVPAPAGLPGEFADYWTGSSAFYAGDTNAARSAWEQLLARPKTERHFRSTWAAFMLGKTWMDADPAKAARYFQLVRELARSGYADALGLAASSYGWEARVELNQDNFPIAIGLYLAQHQAGDPTALQSIRVAAREILDQPPAQLQALASVSVVQQVVSAYIISRYSLNDIKSADETTALIQTWLGAVAGAGPDSVEGAERLALVSYQRGLFDLAERWVHRARSDSAMAQWVRAKLLLRAGNVAEAAKCLSGVVRLFVREGDWPDPPVTKGPDENEPPAWNEDSLLRQSMGELGVLHLARRQYYEALDVLLRSGFWSDAAFIAEYVLTPDEIMAYAERQWPMPEPDDKSKEADSRGSELEDGAVSPRATAIELHYLVARRLARLQRWEEAFDFYPPKWRARFEDFVKELQTGRDPALPSAARAESLWNAARIARHEGMELFGTEVEPDWHLLAGQFEWEPVSVLRSGTANHPAASTVAFDLASVRPPTLRLSASSIDEQRRLREHQVKPDHRFHYRYVAADLAWEAAQLMPNNTDETASLLWEAGCWLKGRDPIAADRFYKALVRRCRATALGQEADRLRWFPKTDPPEVAEPPAVTPEPPPDQPEEVVPPEPDPEPEPAE